MVEISREQLLKALYKVKSDFELTVNGESMLPTLKPGDAVKVCKKTEYIVGDVLVFNYKDEGLLVHRLLKIADGRYCCKGDNSFRLEDVDFSAIMGCVALTEDKLNTEEFISASYKINRIFRKNGYNAELTKQTDEYNEYFQKYLR